ncbi:MAG TPA: SseB family protein [Pirellulaceae bacterium]|nr:SseB family protein [Pirellulaceae bacterium]
MNAEQVIRQHANSPVSDSIEPISKVLAAQTVFVGTEGVTPTQDGKITGKIRLKTGADNQGRVWVYAYTSRAEFHKAFPQGGAFAEMSFPDLFKIVESEQQFAGIYLNSASDASYPIPRELFDQVRNALADRSDG